MIPPLHFRFCPSCGSASRGVSGEEVFRCPACTFTYHFNPAVGAAVFLLDGNGAVLLIRRARDPGRGMLAPPGGFIDIGETAEAAVRREVFEEVGLGIDAVEFLCSQPNEYLYGGVTYRVLDLFFTARAVGSATVLQSGEVADARWFPVTGVDPERLAFPSMRSAWRIFRGRM